MMPLANPLASTSNTARSRNTICERGWRIGPVHQNNRQQDGKNDPADIVMNRPEHFEIPPILTGEDSLSVAPGSALRPIRS
jgi:hypothetical protein